MTWKRFTQEDAEALITVISQEQHLQATQVKTSGRGIALQVEHKRLGRRTVIRGVEEWNAVRQAWRQVEYVLEEA